MDIEIQKTSMEKMVGMTKEIKRQMCLAMPLTVANFLMFALQFVSIMVVGHISHEKLAGASIAISFVNSLGFSVLMGASSALDTLCGQSFGAQNYKMVGLYLQRAMVICVLISIPLAFGTAFSGRILILLRQVPEISMAAESYARLMIPSLFAFGLIQCILKFLQAQKMVLPIMFSSGITAIFHVINCWFFTYKTGLGYRGAALSVSISYWFNLLLLVLYVFLSPSCKSTWTGFSREAFHGLWDFLKLGIPSTLMVCFQNWQFELLLLLSGLLNNPELQTSLMSISQNISSLVYAVPLGLSGAVSTRISNELGAQNPGAAVLAILTAAVAIIIEGLAVGFGMIGGRNLWGHLYTKEREVVNAVAVMIPWIALSHCIDGFQCVLLGTIRGSGRQKMGVFVCLGSYYLVGIPASILLGFVFHMDVKGLWIGNICAIFVQDAVLLIMTMFTNWEKQVMKALERAQTSDKSEPNYWIANMPSSRHSFSIVIDPTELSYF
ncbi:MATE efflux family protein DTX1 [Dendrobium catenatum]|uniref:Protein DETOXIFICATION n=1 Tax=Dendrobium catenatum TaxID=906689 RepID=A0A2I0WHU7_9ASPA|nr:MATE efflux family protein DTX1 [Dendrobium catenatum]